MSNETENTTVETTETSTEVEPLMSWEAAEEGFQADASLMDQAIEEGTEAAKEESEEKVEEVKEEETVVKTEEKTSEEIDEKEEESKPETIKVKVNGKEEAIHFNFSVIESPTADLNPDNPELQQWCGSVLHDVLDMAIAKGDAVINEVK